jgi:hypothetical protein
MAYGHDRGGASITSIHCNPQSGQNWKLVAVEFKVIVKASVFERQPTGFVIAETSAFSGQALELFGRKFLF